MITIILILLATTIDHTIATVATMIVASSMYGWKCIFLPSRVYISYPPLLRLHFLLRGSQLIGSNDRITNNHLAYTIARTRTFL
jgi:hypothetical protein